MPLARPVLNAFTASEVKTITGLSMPMINYLKRMDFLIPSYGKGLPKRGKIRYYSYRDLVIARLIQRLRDAGVELQTIKQAVERLRSDDLWSEIGDELPSTLSWLKTDGCDVFVERADGFLEHMRSDRQGAFGFLVNVSGLATEIREAIPPGPKRDNFSMQNRELLTEPTKPRKRTQG